MMHCMCVVDLNLAFCPCAFWKVCAGPFHSSSKNSLKLNVPTQWYCSRVPIVPRNRFTAMAPSFANMISFGPYMIFAGSNGYFCSNSSNCDVNFPWHSTKSNDWRNDMAFWKNPDDFCYISSRSCLICSNELNTWFVHIRDRETWEICCRKQNYINSSPRRFLHIFRG